MKKIKLFGFAAVLFAIVALTGCGRSDLTLTVNNDGSFDVCVDYGIEKAMMGNPEVQEQLKSLVTDTLDENGVAYTELENDDFVIIRVEREFKDIKELTNEDAWRGIGMVPRFSSTEEAQKLYTRYENGRLKINGTLSAEAFQAVELISQGSASSFGGSLTVVLPEEAESSSAAAGEDPLRYVWSGTADETVDVSLSSAPMEAAPAEKAAGEKQTGKKAATAESGSKARAWAAAAIILAAAVCVLCAWLFRRRKTAKTENQDEKE